MEKTPAQIDQHLKEKHMKRIERAHATDIMIEHSLWTIENGPEGDRICAAKGCNHTYLRGMIPTPLDMLTHQLRMLEEAGFGFSPAPVEDPRIAKVQSLIASVEANTIPDGVSKGDPYFAGHADGFRVAINAVKNLLED
jgi:hypothetical protein